MFSTKNIYRVAVLVHKRDAELTMEKIISLGILHPKKVEKSFDGPFISRSASHFIPYAKKISELAEKIELQGITCKGKISIDDPDSFLNSIVSKLGPIEASITGKKSTSDDLLKLKAGLELIELKKAVAELFKSSENADGFVIMEGWIDKDSLPALKKEICSPSVLLEYLEPDDGPTLLKNKWPFSVFEYISKLYPPFRYGSVDVTPFIAVTFPIIFGLMFASVLDGIILLAISAYWYWKSKNAASELLATLAVSAIFFGFLFGESAFFGTGSVIAVYKNPILLIIISLGIGAVHLALGHIIGIKNNLSEKNQGEAIAHAGFLLLMLSGLGFLLSFQFWVAGLIISLIMIISGGAKSISEMPHALGHLFSYARIFAISISHYSIARVFDSLAAKFGWTSPQNILITLLILMFGHFILLTIELLIALIHTLRLHILEFGTKFMLTGLEWFKAYKFTNKYSVISYSGKKSVS